MPSLYKHRKDVTNKATIPKNLRGRPSYHGFIVPYFVSWFLNDEVVREGTAGAVPKFPVVDMRRAAICRKQHMCWVCGKKLGSFRTFVFGPVGAIARQSIEPPSHRECAIYAVKVCPHMVGARPINTERVIPGATTLEFAATYHAGVVVLWTTRDYEVEVLDPSRGIVIYVPGDASNVQLWTEGRFATREEISVAIRKSIAANKLYDKMPAKEIGWRVQQLMFWAEGGEKP